MRILQVLHDFLPRHVAGVEVYTDQLARRLSKTHDVALLYSEVVPDLPNYTLRRGRHGDVLTYEVVNNHLYRGFSETYRNREVEALMSTVLDDFAPEVVHVQHLLNLSIGLVDELRRRKIPAIMTLHDHWLACARGGQRFHPQLGRCETLDVGRCAGCTASMNRLGFAARTLVRRLERHSGEGAALDLTEVRPERVVSENPDWVHPDRYLLDGEPQPTWVAHPPARLAFRVAADRGGSLLAAIAMHPDTFEAEGGGVRFSVRVNGAVRFAHTLDPKRRAGDREPVRLRAELDEGENLVELQTEAVPADRWDFCAAGWIHPRIVSMEGGLRVRPSAVAHALRGLGRSMRTLGAASQRRRVRTRWDEMRDLLSSVDHVIAPSGYLMEEFIRFGLAEGKVHHCDYGFESEGFSPRSDLPDVCRRFGFVGSPMPHKGLHVLLRAFEEMPRDARLDVCGSLEYAPDYAARLRASVRHPGVRFVGGLAPDRVPGFLAEIECLVTPSVWHENSPLTIHEAFLAGIPVVASRIGGQVELLDGGGGLLYDPDDPAALRACLQRVYREPGLLRALASSAPPVKSMADHVAELTELYRRLAESA